MHGFYYLHLNLHHHDEQYTDLLNRVFDMWDQTFTQVARKNQQILDPGEFFRSHHVGVLMFEDEIVGFNLFTFFDLSLLATTRHAYFQALGTCSPTRLNSEKIKRILTMEYFTLAPQWRRQLQETPWGEIITGMGLKFLDKSSADAVLGTPRMDLRVHEMCYRLGAYNFQDPVKRLNYECAVVLFPKVAQRTFSHPLTRLWVKNLAIDEGSVATPLLSRIPVEVSA